MKGKTNNPNGRPKGTPNKTTTELRAVVNELLLRNFEQVERDLQALTPESRLQVILKLLELTLPKPTSDNGEQVTPTMPNFTLNLGEFQQAN